MMPILPSLAHRSRRAAATVILAASVSLCVDAAAWARQAPAFAPPGGTPPVCRSAVPDLGRDWTAWTGEETGRSRKDLIAIAGEYAVGSARVTRDPATARRLVDHLRAGGASDTELAVAEARLALAEPTTERRAAARRSLEDALAAGSRSAARMLGDMLAAEDADAAIAAYRVATGGGDPRAAVALARLLAAREGTDPAEIDLAVLNAFTTALSAISTGDCRSARLMAQLYTDGTLVEARPDLATAWKRYAADLGDPGAALELARAYRFGRGVDPDPALAVRYLEIAARSGRASALLPVGVAYLTGEGVPRDAVKAETYLTQAADAGRVEAWHQLAQLWRGDHGDAPQPDKAFAALTAAARAPGANPVIALDLGRAWRDGFGTPADARIALDHLTRAAEAGSAEAALEAATLLETGADGVPPDLKRAIRLHRLAASSGNAAAAAKLATIYRCGKGVPRSLDLASVWAERAAFMGSASSMRAVAGTMMRSDVPAVRHDGFLLLRQSAKRGNLDAIAEMVIAYETGRGPDAADRTLAGRWVEHGRRQSVRPGDFDVALARARLAEGSDGFAEAERLLEGAVAAGSTSAGYELARALDVAGLAGEAQLVELLTGPAAAGHLPAMRKLGEVLGPERTAAGRTGQDWLSVAAAGGDFAARLALSANLDPAGRKAALEQIEADSLACDPTDFARLAVAWNRLGDDGRAKAGAYARLAADTVAGGDGATLFQIADVLLATGGAVAEVRRMLDRAVEAGEPKALSRLAEGLAAGTFGPPEPEAARQLLLARGDGGDRDADVTLLRLAASGLLSPDGTDIARVMDRVGDDLDAMSGDVLKIASRARDGVFGPEGQRFAREWLQRAAEGGRVTAMRTLAEILLYGSEAERDPTAGLAWMRKAAEAGDRDALLALSAAYEVGFLVDVDPGQAAALRAAADAKSLGASEPAPSAATN
jgi:TPR repeat protein